MRSFVRAVVVATLFIAGAAPVCAQGFDVTQYVADPNTYLFSDSKTTVQVYLLEQLQSQTTCCGMDDIYMEIKYDAAGNVTSSRVMNSNNECNKKSLPDIVKYIRWKVANPAAIRPIYLALRPAIDCKGTAQDNQYKPIGAPNGYSASTATATATTTTTAATTTMATATQPTDDAETTTATAASTMPVAQVTNAQSGRDSALAKLEMPYELPKPVYKAKDLQPNEQHKTTTTNVGGPSAGVSFGLTQSKTALYVKKSMREAGVCGVAQVLAELQLEADGSVTGIRFLKYNSEPVKQAALKVLSGMKFQSQSTFRSYPIFEFKTFIDCTPDRTQKMNLDKVPDYFYAPGEEGKMAQQGVSPQPNTNVGLPKDE